MYTCFIAHRDPEMCPLGAFAFYLHYIHDFAKIDSKYNIDYTLNKSWRAVRPLFCVIFNQRTNEVLPRCDLYMALRQLSHIMKAHFIIYVAKLLIKLKSHLQ